MSSIRFLLFEIKHVLVYNSTLSSFHGGLLVITLTVPLNLLNCRKRLYSWSRPTREMRSRGQMSNLMQSEITIEGEATIAFHPSGLWFQVCIVYFLNISFQYLLAYRRASFWWSNDIFIERWCHLWEREKQFFFKSNEKNNWFKIFWKNLKKRLFFFTEQTTLSNKLLKKRQFLYWKNNFTEQSFNNIWTKWIENIFFERLNKNNWSELSLNLGGQN